MQKQNTATGPKFFTKDWRGNFSQDMLAKAHDLVRDEKVRNFSTDPTGAYAAVLDNNNVYHVDILNAPASSSEEWDPESFHCSCMKKRKGREWNPKTFSYYKTCQHEAAVLEAWENVHGPWRFKETEEEYKERIHREELEQRRTNLEIRRKEEQNILLPATDFIRSSSPETYFDIRRAIGKRKTTQFALNRALEIIKDGKVEILNADIGFGKDGRQVMRAAADIGDELETHRTSIYLGFDNIERASCSCEYNYRFSSSNRQRALCEHELLLLKSMQKLAEQQNIGDATDQNALLFFQAMAAPGAKFQAEDTEIPGKKKTLILSPRIVVDGGDVSVTFKLGRIDEKNKPAEKSLVIKNLKTMAAAYAEEAPFELSKKQTIDFSKEDFAESSLPWLTFIQRRVSEAAEVNSRLQQRAYYGYNPSLKMQDSLTGALLDQFYETAEGGTYESVNRGNNNEPGLISVGHANMRVQLRTEAITNQSGTFFGIRVIGNMPVILPGSSGSYVLSKNNLSKITKEEEAALQPFLAASDDEGNIRFNVGKGSLSEFYYRVIPAFLQSRYIDFIDTCSQMVETLLPPEAEFLFQLDVEDKRCICRTFVSYNDKRFNLFEKNQNTETYRDQLQESRVRLALDEYFPYSDPDFMIHWEYVDDDFMYKVLSEIVPALSRMGEVQGSEAFSRFKLRPAPAIQVGVGIESGLMDISVISKDMSPEELLEILGSYRQKKKYHRLKSGEFIRLGQNDQLQSLDSMLSEIDVKAEDIIGKEAHLPVYRALYLDSMLKKHEELAASRDRTYRALLKNFATIRDTDYETPKAQADILRNYQEYGFKWLRTLTSAGFGGILADEMGLGKTLQAISLLQSLADEGSTGISMIVCPASLVYNWQEEFSRFAPTLKVETIAGTASQRKNQLSSYSEKGSETPDVLITSYDLFRKDIVFYEKIRFMVMILDEAQYIKNQKAAVTKAVKAASAQYRFALTGTPVENRLAELWSIFDFLMPGFLYSYQEFSSRFETPIVKNKDEEASARLRQMTAPFILRRLKTDVLKDLPEKLEEVRYTRFEDEQRKVYDGQVVHMKQMLEGIGEAGQDKIKILTELMRIRQICCDPSLLFDNYQGGSAKREACLELIQSAIGGGHRMLLFSQFTSMLELLEEDLKTEGIEYLKLTGATPKDQRIRMVREFNEGTIPVFLISLKAGGTGLNLTGADVVIHYDPWWNIAAQNQATDRAHRIGQTNTVTVYRLIVKDSIEEKILALQEAKRDLAESILTGDQTAITSLTNEELLDLLS